MKLLIENFRKFLAEGADDIDVGDLQKTFNLSSAQKAKLEKGVAAGNKDALALVNKLAKTMTDVTTGKKSVTGDTINAVKGAINNLSSPTSTAAPAITPAASTTAAAPATAGGAEESGIDKLPKDYKFVFLTFKDKPDGGKQWDYKPGFLWATDNTNDFRVKVDPSKEGVEDAKAHCKEFRTKCWKYRNKVPGLKDIVGSKPPIRRSRSGIRKNLKYSKTVELIQQGLDDLGYGLGPKGIDGKLGNKTLMAIANLKRNIAKQSGAKAAARVTKNLKNLLNFIKTRSPTSFQKLKVPTAKQAADSMAQSAPTQTPDDNDIFKWDPYEDQEKHKKQDEDEKYDN